MSNKLAGRFTFRTLLKFSLPSIVMMVFMSLYTMVDGIFVSQLLGTSALSAVNIVFPMVGIPTGVGIMLGSGGSAVVALKMGQGKNAEARQDFTLIILTGAMLGLIITILGQLFLEPILYFLGADDTIFPLCMAYAKPLLFFTVPAILQMMFQTFFVTAGRPALGLFITVLGGIANIVLDYLFIAVLQWGIAGAAIATGIGLSIPGLFGFLWFLLYRKEMLYFVPPVWRGKMLLVTAGNGSSEMVTNISSSVVTLLFNLSMMHYLGENGVAAITIVLYAEYLLTAIYLGYSTGIAPVLSYNHGENNIVQLKRLFFISMKFLGICTAVTFIGAYLFTRPIVGVFAPAGSEVYKFAVQGFHLYAVCFLFKGINIYASSMFTALSDGKTSAILSFLRTLVFIVIGIIFLPWFLGVNGVWLAVPFAELLSVLLSVYCFYHQAFAKWQKRAKEWV